MIVLVDDRVSRHVAGHDVHDMAAAGQLQALRQRLPFRSAGERVEVAHDVADAQGRTGGGRGMGRVQGSSRVRARARGRSAGP